MDQTNFKCIRPARIVAATCIFVVTIGSLVLATERWSPAGSAALSLPMEAPPRDRVNGPAPERAATVAHAVVSRAASAAESTAASPTSVVACVDVRSGESFDYAAAHLRGDGTLDSASSAGSVRLCLGTTDGLHQVLCADGAGGVYAGWVELAGDGDIRLQRFTATGSIAPSWPASGLIICDADRSQYNLDLAGDGAGGVFVAWQDFRSGRSSRIYVQHVDGSGAVDSNWPAEGLPVTAAASEQSEPRIVADGGGGALIAWQDRRSGVLDIYVERVRCAGASSAWPPDGVRLAEQIGEARLAGMVADSLGRSTIVWTRSEAGGTSLYALRLAADAPPDTSDMGAPVALAPAAEQIGQVSARASADGSAWIAWSERRSGAASLKTQRLAATGAVAPGWPAGGASVGTAWPGGGTPGLLPLADGGALVAWEDSRDSTSDIYAQRLTGDGLVAPGWPAAGRGICVAAGEQFAPSLVTDGSGGAYVTWADDRTSARAGYLTLRPAIGADQLTVETAVVRPGHARLTWRIPHGIAASFTGMRRIDDAGDFEVLGAIAPDDSGRVVLDDPAAPEGAVVTYRLAILAADYEQYLAPLTVKIPSAPARLTLSRVRALPAEDAIAFSLLLPRGAAPTATLYDIQGRRMEERRFEGLEPGGQALALRVPRRLASGVYFLRVAQGNEARNAKVVFIR